MNKRGLSEKWPNAILVIVSLAVVVIPFWQMPAGVGISETMAQGSNKSLHRFQNYGNEPLQVFDLKVAHNRVKFAEPFSGSDDWLRSLTFRVKNLSGKDIVHIEFHLNFPETKSSGNEMSFRFNLGQWPARPGSQDLNEPLLLRANDDATVSLEGDRYEELVRFIESRSPMSALKRADIRIGFVHFADGTAWSAGTFYARDPNNPNGYIPIPTQKIAGSERRPR